MKKSTKKIIGAVVVIGIIAGSGIAYYLFNMPARDVQATDADYSLSSQSIVEEYLKDTDAANQKYLAEDGDSKVLLVKGKIFSIHTDQNNQKVILLKDSSQNAGVSCTFTQETNKNTTELKPGQTVTVKGVIRSGAGYDEDLELYENVIMEKCDLIK